MDMMVQIIVVVVRNNKFANELQQIFFCFQTYLSYRYPKNLLYRRKLLVTCHKAETTILKISFVTLIILMKIYSMCM